MTIAAYESELEEVRSVCAGMGVESWTSRTYQEDVLGFILDSRDKGAVVVEVGCYRGGLSAMLAFLCSRLGGHLYTMDIDETAVASTRAVLSRLGLQDRATVFRGPLSEFARDVTLPAAPVLVILDGDHSYAAVTRDLGSVRRLNRRPHALAFHDFSLRHPTTDERVDDAVRDSFGADAPVVPIGLSMKGEGHWTRERPGEDGHYWNVPGSEGALLVVPDTWWNAPQRRGLFGMLARLAGAR